MPGSRLTRRWVLRGIYAAGQSVLSFEFWVFEFWVLSLSFETDKEVSFEGNICRGRARAVRNRRVSCPILSKGIRTALNRPAQTFCYCFSSIKSIQLFCISCRPGHNCFASTGAQDNHSVLWNGLFMKLPRLHILVSANTFTMQRLHTALTGFWIGLVSFLGPKYSNYSSGNFISGTCNQRAFGMSWFSAVARRKDW